MRDPDKIEESNGLRFIRLKTGTLLSFWDVMSQVEGAHTRLGRSFSRAFKLARDEYDLERLEWRIEQLEDHLGQLRKHLNEVRGVNGVRERIALLRNVDGRTPEEAEAFIKKADELEARLANPEDDDFAAAITATDQAAMRVRASDKEQGSGE